MKAVYLHRSLVIFQEMFKLTLKELIDALRRRFKRQAPVQATLQATEHTPSSKLVWQIQDSGPLLAEQTPDGDKKPETSNETPRPSSGGGNRPSPQDDGPPDLDALWNDFNRRLGSIFGGKGSKDGQKDTKTPNSPKNSSSDKPSTDRSPEFESSVDSTRNSQRDTNKPSGLGGGSGNGSSPIKSPFGDLQFPRVGFGLVLAVIAAIWIVSGFFIVQEGQAGVVLQFGKYKYTARPGINWRLPYPIQAHEIVNLSGVRSVEIGRPILIKATNLKDSSMLTEDENIIDVKFAVQYRLKDPTEYLFTNRDPDAAVVQAAETAVREIVGRSKMDTVLYEGREKIAIDLAASIQKILDSYKAGILITSVTVQNVQPPEPVQASFDDAVKAGQDQERLKNEGQAYANEIIPRAKGTAARLIQEAEGYKAKVIATAEGDASRFKQVYVEYAKAPQVTRDRMYIDTMQQVYNNVTKVMVDTRSSNSMIYLPLDKLIQQSSGEPPALNNLGANANSSSAPSVAPSVSSLAPSVSSVAPSAGGSAVPVAPSPVDKRDSLRSRDRDVR
jgi:membrane protease subunit HflK